MEQSPLLDEVRTTFRALLESGSLRLESSTYEAQAFGNAAVILCGSLLDVRILRDRGELIAQVRPSARSGDWWLFQRVLRAVGAAEAPPEGLLTVAQIASLLRTHWTEIEDGLSRFRVAATLKKLREIDAEALNRLTRRGSEPIIRND